MALLGKTRAKHAGARRPSFFRLGGKLIRIKMDDVQEFERNGGERVSNVKEV